MSKTKKQEISGLLVGVMTVLIALDTRHDGLLVHTWRCADSGTDS